jgi:hypothetical protein
MTLFVLAACGGSTVALAPADSPSSPADVVPLDAPTGTPDWTVDCGGSGDFETITEAIDEAAEGEWIEVAPCTYEETVDFDGKSLWISSSAGPEDTIIDARRSYGVVADQGEGDGAALVGFTIQNGGGSYGAVYANMSALRLEDVLIQDSSGGYFVLYFNSSDIEMQDVSFKNVTASYYMLYSHRGAVVADGLELACAGNSVSVQSEHGSFFLDHSEVVCRTGYAIYNQNSVGRVHRSTLVGAVYATTDPDHYSDTNTFENTVLSGNMAQEYGSLVFRNSILEGGTITTTDVYDTNLQASVFEGARCALDATWTGTDTAVEEPEVDIEYNDFYGLVSPGCDGTTWVGIDGNIDDDPLFTDSATGDYSTATGSPLVDAGLEDDAYDDPDGSRNDIGLYGGPRSIGGGW